MSNDTTGPDSGADLRSRAVARLTGHGGSEAATRSASAALGVLHELASNPSTAADALALLHELQVHQVELDLQAEELRVSRTELEAALHRQLQLYDAAPVGYFTIDLDTVLHELNSTGATLLGSEHDSLLGQPLHGFLSAASARALRTTLARAGEGRLGEASELQLLAHGREPRTVLATINADPADPEGKKFLVAFMETGSLHAKA